MVGLFTELLEATAQGSSISPINFDAQKFHNSEVYKLRDEAKENKDAYLENKKMQNEQRRLQKEMEALENRPWYEKTWDTVSTFTGEVTGYYDTKRAATGIDPVTGEKLSEAERVKAAAFAAAGFIPVVGWAGRAAKGGNAVYKTVKGAKAVEHSLDAYKSVKAFSYLHKAEYGIYGLANGFGEYITGKDIFGEKLNDDQRKQSLTEALFVLGVGGAGYGIDRVAGHGLNLKKSLNTNFKSEQLNKSKSIGEKRLDKVGDVHFEGKGSADYGRYSTKIDSQVTEIEQASLPDWLKETFTDGNYRTVITDEEVAVYRSFGGNTDAGGGFAKTEKAANRINAKIDTALLPEWGNSRMYEAEVIIPKGETLSIGKVAPQTIKSTGTILIGGADQILLPQKWPLDWITDFRIVPSK